MLFAFLSLIRRKPAVALRVIRAVLCSLLGITDTASSKSVFKLLAAYLENKIKALIDNNTINTSLGSLAYAERPGLTDLNKSSLTSR